MRAACLFFAAAALAAQTPGTEPIEFSAEGRGAGARINALKTDERIGVYTKMVAAKPDASHPKNLLAKAFIQKMRETVDFGYLGRASKLIDDVLARDPGNYEALRLRSEVAMERHEFARVREYSEEMAKFTPDDPWNWGTLGDSLMEQGEYPRAAEAYRKMVTLRPDLSSYNRLAYYRFVTGDAAGAVSLMQAAIQAGSQAPENIAWCLADLGKIYFKVGRIQEAEDSFRRSLLVFPGYYPAYAGLGSVMAARNKLPEAIDNYKHAQAAVPLPDFAAALEALYARAGKPDESRKQRQLLDVIDQVGRAGNEKTNRNLALIYADQGRNLDRALELVENEVKVRPDVYTSDALAWVLFKRKEYGEAEASSAKAIALGTPEPAFYYHAGMIARALKKNTQSAEYLRKSLSLNPQFDFTQTAAAERTLRELAREGPGIP